MGMSLALALLAVVLTDAEGMAEYGRYGWWLVKPVVTGAPCPECPAMLALPASPPDPVGSPLPAPSGLRVQ